MNKKRCIFSLAVALALLPPVRGNADSVITSDGEAIFGTVTKTATGYTVQTANGTVTLTADQVRKVLYDHPQAGATGTSPPADAPAKPKAADPMQVHALIDQGLAAMTAAQYADARDAFKDALSLDKQNPLAAKGLGYAYIGLGKPVKALEPLEIAAQKLPLDRSMALAWSSALVANHNSMRAVKYLTPYMLAHSSPVDEPMLNALGIALTQVDNSAKKSQLYRDAGALYRKQNAALEATIDGKRRWGVEWLDKKEVDAKEKEHAKVQKATDDANTRLQNALNAQQAAQSDLEGSAVALGQRNQARINNAQSKVQQTTADVSTAQAAYDKAAKELAAAPAPTFPTSITMDSADLVVLPEASLASAAPAPGPVVKPDAPVIPVKPTDTATGDPPAPVKPKPTKPVETPAADDDTPRPAARKAPAAARHVTRYAVGFAIAPDVVVTAASAVEDATTIKVTIADGKSVTAQVLRSNKDDGLALLKLDNTSLPCLPLATSAGSGTLTCYGFPEVDLFNPIAHDMSVAAGPQEDSWNVRFSASPRLPGGPLVQGGYVVGVELGNRDSELASVPAATLKQLMALVADSANAATSAAANPKKAIVQVTAER